MEAQDYPVIAEVDIAVIGGGMAGVAAALASAAAGRQTLLVEPRPLLGWEATSAFALDWPGADTDGTSVAEALRKAGGTRGDRMDAPILEMVLERMLTQAGVDILFYSAPVALWRDGERVGGVVVGNKSGRQIVRARAFVDATEEGLLWRMAGSEFAGAAGVRGRTAVFFNHVTGDPVQREAPEVPGVSALRLRPSVWPGEFAVEYEAEAPADGWGAPVALGLALRRSIPAVVRQLRAQMPEFAEALLTHTAREPFPLTGPALGAGPQHPAIPNLFGAGVWLSGAAERAVAGSLPERWRRGAEAGALVARMAAEMPLPGLGVEGPAPASVDAPACDVLVVGGGTGGALAGIAAARQGAKVTLLESSHFLGGIGTGGGIHSYYHGFAGGLQDEIDARTHALAVEFGATQRLMGFHPDAKQIVLEQMAEEAGMAMVFRTTLIGVRCEGGRVQAAETVGPLGAVCYPAKVLVDGTGDADLAAMAGAEFTLGRATDDLAHSFSQACQALNANGAITLKNFDAGYVDPTDVTDLSRARRLGLSHLWNEEGFTAENRLLTISPLLGLRQSRQVVGDYVMTLNDQISGRRFPDVISYTRAHYDNHAFDYENEGDEAVLWVWLLGAWRDQFACEVPYRCLLPKGLDNILIACRALSLEHAAHMMFRMQRDLQRVGEVAGVAAALAALGNCTPRQLNVRRIQEALLATGALSRESLIPGQTGTVADWIAQLGEAQPQPKAAVWHLSHAGEEAIPPLLEALRSDSERVRFWAAVALAMHNRPEAAPELLRCLRERADVKPEGERTAPFWQGVMVLLGRIANAEAAQEICKVLGEPERSLDALVTALRALGRIGDPESVAAIRALLSREELPDRRVFQVSSAGRKPVVDDARWQLDLAAAETLALLGAPDVSLAEKHRQDPRAYVRRYAERVRRMSLLPIGY